MQFLWYGIQVYTYTRIQSITYCMHMRYKCTRSENGAEENAKNRAVQNLAQLMRYCQLMMQMAVAS